MAFRFESVKALLGYSTETQAGFVGSASLRSVLIDSASSSNGDNVFLPIGET
jgi:hypothetical protein